MERWLSAEDLGLVPSPYVATSKSQLQFLEIWLPLAPAGIAQHGELQTKLSYTCFFFESWLNEITTGSNLSTKIK